jgi:diguanylate cyclase (GGDEF)-like protein
MARGQRERWAQASVAVLLALTLLGPAGLPISDPDAVAVVAQTTTALVMAVFLVAGVRRGGPLWHCHLLLLLAMGSGLVASVIRLAQQLQSADAVPVAAWEAKSVGLLWVPLVVGALLSIPSGEVRQGFRVRAFTDGLLAASSLWYLLMGLGVADALHASGLSLSHRVQLLASPVGDVFVVATALAVYARCPQAERRLVGWALAGLSAIGCGDVLFAIPEDGQVASPGSDAGLVSQFGMLLLVLAAASTGRAAPPRRPSSRGLGVAGALPFVPLLGCVVLTTGMILQGKGMPDEQLLPALCVALALMGRQLAASRDKERLVQALRARERDLEAEVRRDALTGLGNRTALVEALARALEDPTDWPVSVLLLDLNDFKVINDNHGHDTGDAVLVEVAARLRSAVRSVDAVARLGGDEFAIVATQVHDGADVLSSRLLAALEPPVLIGNQAFCVRASIGVVNDQEGASAAAALAFADVAMYEAKGHTRAASAVSVLSPEGRERAARRLRIQEAVADPQLDQLSVAYQPVVDLRTGAMRGFEALLRWDHPVLGSIPPDVFIPMAERAGSISVLGEHALITALRDLAALQASACERLAVGVNVSPAQLVDPEFVTRVLRHVDELGLSTDQLNVEITEQAFEADLSAVTAGVNALTAAGVSVAVDDFGTGYSSLQYLQRLPVDVMKIDRSFVWEASESARAQKLLASIVSMATVLDLQLVAEGIETVEQLRGLQAMGCELGQGYLFSRPIPFAQIHALVLTGHRFPVGSSVPVPREARSEVLL